MSDIDPAEACPICKHRHMVRSTIELTFHQVTDRGRVTCRVALPRSVCPHCGFDALGAEAEAIMDQAVREEYAKLPSRSARAAVSEPNAGAGAKGWAAFAKPIAMLAGLCLTRSAPLVPVSGRG